MSFFLRRIDNLEYSSSTVFDGDLRLLESVQISTTITNLCLNPSVRTVLVEAIKRIQSGTLTQAQQRMQ